MADLAECFRTIADSSTGAGECLISRIEGEAAAGQEGSIGFSFKDSSGNVVLPSLTAAGKIPVDTEASARTCLHAHGELAAGSSGVLADVTGASLTLALTKLYQDIGISVCCLRTSLFQLVYTDDVGVGDTETIIGEYIVGPGQYTVCCALPCREIDTTGGTGVQELKLQAKNFTNASSLRGELSVSQLD